MEEREQFIAKLRGNVLGEIYSDSSSEETFQNKTLRPILKIQNDLLLAIFINYAVKQKKVFFDLSPEKKLNYIENVIHRDIKFRNSLKGIIIALFTLEEYKIYIQNSTAFNKRMMTMLIERYKNQILVLQLDL